MICEENERPVLWKPCERRRIITIYKWYIKFDRSKYLSSGNHVSLVVQLLIGLGSLTTIRSRWDPYLWSQSKKERVALQSLILDICIEPDEGWQNLNSIHCDFPFQRIKCCLVVDEATLKTRTLSFIIILQSKFDSSVILGLPCKWELPGRSCPLP